MNWFFKKKEKAPKYLIAQQNILVFHVKCDQCGELFRSVIRKNSELMQNFEEPNTYEINKQLIGSRCQNRIEVYFLLNQGLAVLKQIVTGGKLITQEEYMRIKEEKST